MPLVGFLLVLPDGRRYWVNPEVPSIEGIAVMQALLGRIQKEITKNPSACSEQLTDDVSTLREMLGSNMEEM